MAERLLRLLVLPPGHDHVAVGPERDLGRKAIETFCSRRSPGASPRCWVPKGTLAERLLRHVRRTPHEEPARGTVPKGTLAERLLRRHVRAVVVNGQLRAGPERDLGRKAIETPHPDSHKFHHPLLRLVPKGTLAERLLRPVNLPSSPLRTKTVVPKGTLAERLLRLKFNRFENLIQIGSPERDLGRKAIET